MDIKWYENEIKAWERLRFPGAPSYLSLIKLTEEVGELSAAFIRRYEHRVGTPAVDAETKIRDAVGDIFVTLAVFCARERLPLSTIIAETWAEVSARNFEYSGPLPDGTGPPWAVTED